MASGSCGGRLPRNTRMPRLLASRTMDCIPLTAGPTLRASPSIRSLAPSISRSTSKPAPASTRDNRARASVDRLAALALIAHGRRLVGQRLVSASSSRRGMTNSDRRGTVPSSDSDRGSALRRAVMLSPNATNRVALIRGGAVTVSGNVHDAVRWRASVATHRTIEMPTGNIPPLAWRAGDRHRRRSGGASRLAVDRHRRLAVERLDGHRLRAGHLDGGGFNWEEAAACSAYWGWRTAGSPSPQPTQSFPGHAGVCLTVDPSPLKQETRLLVWQETLLVWQQPGIRQARQAA